MAFSLRNLFKRHEEPAAATMTAPTADEEPETEIACPHTVLGPHWDDPADLGKEDLASSYKCDVCGETFTPEEALALRATEGERLKKELGLSEQT